ncbi:hypothetical protein SAMN06265337_3796 [Hymenobacter gelipurpurascens]|uniref:Dolichyl-phosphate-mannose-protein mannosyltransferase n=1 Tax=Hymenobacter gelipurpurascens TaxID=89968 RepID=A0A212UGM2_9BACT|nr:hypothetical protein [Hymenobacter gelipurpurascens]SNC77214.1 hypothetical protein SAMN06265337_3796 [Hymenobacter gelipurpurascens]
MPEISSTAPPRPVWNPHLAAILVFVGAALLFYLPYLQWLPRGIHEWAQADRLALALNFYDRGMDFFHPRTFSVASIDSVTGVEFPLPAYLAALLGKVAGRQYISLLFRVITITVSVTGYYFLFRIVFAHTQNFAAALLPGFFLLASPVFAYYSGNYLPDPASASLVFMGLYYVQHFWFQQRRLGYLAIGLGLLTLAALLKISSVIYLGATVVPLLGLSYFQPAVFNRKQKLLFLLILVLAGAALVGYTIYNKYLNAAYASDLFLAAPRPITTPEERFYVWQRITELWWQEYFIALDYWLLRLGAGLAVLGALIHWRLWPRHLIVVGFLGIAVVGGRLFYELMGLQFVDHDYYFISPYIPLAVLVVMLGLIGLDKLVGHQWYVQVALLALVVLLGFNGYRQHQARMADPYRSFSDYYAYRWMQEGAAELARQQVPASARVLVLGEPDPNLALVYFDRRGLTWQADLAALPEDAILQKMVDLGLSYLIMSRESYNKFAPVHAGLLAHSQTILDKPAFVVLKPSLANRHW